MKSILATGLLAAAFVVSQLPAQAQLQAGLRLGLNASRVIGDNAASPDMGFGYQAGIFARFTVAGVHVQPELVAAARNYSFTQTINADGVFSNTDKKIKATYLEFPVYLVFDLHDRLDLLLGPYLAFKTSSKQDVANLPGGDGFELEGGELGLSGGVTYFFKHEIDLSLRGQYALSNGYFKQNQNIPGPESLSVRNLSFQVTLGLPISSSGAGDAIPKTYKESY